MSEDVAMSTAAEYSTRSRIAAPDEGIGLDELVGRAWSGFAPVTGVDVSTDGGATWAPATVDSPHGRWAWARWTYRWSATPGEHELLARARDAAGNVQSVDQPWNVQGMGNNMAQRVTVFVEEAA